MFDYKLNNDEKRFIEILEKAKRYVKGELELDCDDGKWYAMDYRKDFECAFPIEAKGYDLPVITDDAAKRHGIDIIKCCDKCGIAYVG